jgi:glycosyltransferase involved in cell wall biosynthesis
VRTVQLLIPVDYAAGGLQRSAVALRNALESAGYAVTIYCFKVLPDGLARQYPFVRPIAGERRGKLFFWLATFAALRRQIREQRPDAVIAFGTVPAILLPIAAAFIKVPVTIGSERAYLPAERLPALLGRLRRVCFPRLDFIVCQTAGIRNWYAEHLRIGDRKLVVIPNIVAAAPSSTIEIGRAPAERENILCVGRLEEQKGFHFALEIFARVLESRPKALLTMVGDGPLRDELKRSANALGIGARINFRGQLADLADEWAGADLFLFTSLYEGFPNALAEAMANGLAAVAFDCPTGPSELITDGVDGYLVPVRDVDAASARCVELLANPDERRRFGQRAREVAERYSAEQIGKLWLGLIDQKTPAQVRSAR